MGDLLSSLGVFWQCERCLTTRETSLDDTPEGWLYGEDADLVLCPDCRNTCACFVTPESMWLSAASCGYGSGYEPGSQMEWNPDCPVHTGAVGGDTE